MVKSRSGACMAGDHEVHAAEAQALLHEQTSTSPSSTAIHAPVTEEGGTTSAAATGSVAVNFGGSMEQEQGADNSQSQQPRRLGALQLAFVTFFAVSGGPYGFEAVLASAGLYRTLAGLLVAPVVWSVPLALMTAELSATIPESGGHVVWVTQALGPFCGVINGTLSIMCNFFDNALYPVLFCDYVEGMADHVFLSSPPIKWVMKFLLVVGVTYLNLRGIDVVGDATILFGALVLAPFVVMCLMGMPKAFGTDVAFTHANADKVHVHWRTFLTLLLWNTSGFDSAGSIAAEVAQPSRTYPRALSACVVLTSITYALPTFVGYAFMPDRDEWHDGTFVDVAEEVGGAWLKMWLGAAGTVSAVGLFCTLLCTSSRLLYAMAREGFVPPIFAKVHTKHRTPHISIITNAFVTLLLSAFSFESLAEADMLFYCLSTVLKFAALYSLRRNQPDRRRPYRIPLDDSSLLVMCLVPSTLCIITASLCSWPAILSGVLLVCLASASYLFKKIF